MHITQIIVSSTVTTAHFLLLIIYQTYTGHQLRVQIKEITFLKLMHALLDLQHIVPSFLDPARLQERGEGSIDLRLCWNHGHASVVEWSSAFAVLACMDGCAEPRWLMLLQRLKDILRPDSFPSSTLSEALHMLCNCRPRTCAIYVAYRSLWHSMCGRLITVAALNIEPRELLHQRISLC
jgi:hypothetical protein